MLPIAYLFKRSHRIRLEIANGNSPLTDAVFTHPYPPTAVGTDTIHHDARARIVPAAAGGDGLRQARATDSVCGFPVSP